MNSCARLNRLLAPDRKCFDVAIDHGLFNERTFLAGIVDMHQTIESIVEAGPDAIQLSPGEATILQALPGRDKPSLVLRVDVANLYNKALPRYLFSQLIENPVELALRLDAACVVANLFMIPDRHEVYHQCIQNICRLKADCESYGMPLMVEALVMEHAESARGYASVRDVEKMVPLIRQAIELGADVIKADPTDQINDYHRIVEMSAGKPVLVRGGDKVSDEQILQRTHGLMRQGARGIVYGRNIIQHSDSKAMTRALMDVVHKGATPEEAMQSFRSFATNQR